MNTGPGIFLYCFQIFVLLGSYLTDRKLVENGSPFTAKVELLANIDQAKSGLGEAVIVGAQWAGFCGFAILGMIVFSLGLKSVETRGRAGRYITFGVCLCLVSVLWPLLI